MKKTLFILFTFMIVMVSCQKDLSYVDGDYSVEFDYHDSHGWKAFIDFTLVSDEITAIDFDYLDSSDNRKSTDADYNETMLGIIGTNPETFLPELETQLMNATIAPDFTGIDGVTGATHSAHDAELLIESALESAVAGDLNVIALQPIYVDGTYSAEYDALDSHGWMAFIEITLAGDTITAADFDYYDVDMNRKSEDADYNETMLGIAGTNPEAFCPGLEATIMSATIRPRLEGVDTWTGATHSSENATELLEATLELAVEGEETEVVLVQPDPVVLK